MKLHVLSRGRSKSKLRPIMVDSLKKCSNYQKALKSSDIKSFHYSIEVAPSGSTVWRKDRSSKWTGWNVSGPKVTGRKAGKADKFGA